MSVPSSTKPTQPGFDAPKPTTGTDSPSPVSPTISEPEEKKQVKDCVEEKKYANDAEPSKNFPQEFDPQFNTEHIDWNELYFIAIHKGRLLYVKQLIATHYAAYVKDYDGGNNTTIPSIPDLPPKILRFVQQIWYETKIVEEAYAVIHSHEDWQTQVDNQDNVSVYYRKEKGDNAVHSIKVQYSSSCHPVELLAVVNEFDLMQEIVNIVPIETRYLKEYTDVNKVVYAKMKLFWPFNARDVVTHVRAYNLLNEFDEVLVWGNTPSEAPTGVTIPALDKKCLRLSLEMAEGSVKPKLMKNGELGTEVVAVFNIDFKSFLPQTLVNWFTRNFAFYACKLIRQRTENLEGTTHEKRIKENELYKEWTQLFKEWKEKKMASQ